MEIAPTYENLTPQVLDRLKTFTNIWEGHLSTIRKVKHRIDLEPPEEKPVHSAP